MTPSKNGRLSAGTIKAGGADDTAKTPEWVGGTRGFADWLRVRDLVGWGGESWELWFVCLFVGWILGSLNGGGGNNTNVWSFSRTLPIVSYSALFGLVI